MKKSNSLFIGEFKSDRPKSGKIYQSDGSVWEGQFKNDVPFGQAVLTMKDGTTFEGKFDGVTELNGAYTRTRDGKKEH